MKQRSNKAGKLYRRKTAAAVLLGMLGLMFLIELIPIQRSYSGKENRKLLGRPEISLKAVADGSFMRQYEEYRSDQFTGRSLWLSVRNDMDLLAGRRDSNGVFKGEDQYLLEDVARPDQEQMKEELGEQVVWVDVSKTLKEHRKEEIYYRTDSRWTTRGAYYAFQKLSETMGLDQEKTPKWQEYVVTNIFNGNLSARSGYGGGVEESIYIYDAEKKGEEPQIVVEYVDEGRKTSTLYDRTKLKETDAYSLFLGGDHARVNIRTTADTTDRLLLVKDSYANCLIPFLTPYYREVIVIDPAYYKGSLDDIMEENKITSVLFLYNGNTFAEDENINGVLR